MKWEYLVWESVPTEAQLNLAGDSGWELVAIDNGPYRIYFKRSIGGMTVTVTPLEATKGINHVSIAARLMGKA